MNSDKSAAAAKELGDQLVADIRRAIVREAAARSSEIVQELSALIRPVVSRIERLERALDALEERIKC